MPNRFLHVADQIYRGGEPSSQDLHLLSNIFDIKTIITLDGNIGGNISPIVKTLGMKHIIIPIGGAESIPLINYLKQNITSILEEQQPVYIHCRHGSDRTGMAIALYRIQHDGISPQAALIEAKKLGFGDKLDPNTQQLYTDAIMNIEDVSDALDADVVSGLRDQGSNPPAYSPQQSFSAPDDIKYNGPDEELAGPNPMMHDPYAFITNRPPDDRDVRRTKLKKVLVEVMVEPENASMINPENMPQVGGRDGGSIPIGVGPTETGGMLNL